MPSAPSVARSEDGARQARRGTPPQERRRSRDSASPPPDGDDDEHIDKRPRLILISSRRRTTDEYGVASRQVTRTVDVGWEPVSVINAGISLLVMSPRDAEIEMRSASEKKRAQYNLFFTLCDLIPGLRETVEWDTVRCRLDNGKSAAKTEDNRTFKTCIHKWHTWGQPLSPQKQERGLNHRECARLLCPITVDWDDITAQNLFIIQHDPPMTANEWPALMFEGKPNPNNLFEGLMRGTLWVNAVRAVIFPPSVVDALNPLNSPSEVPDFQSNRRAKAEMYGMDHVTPGLLAYVAVELRFAISSEQSFNARGGSFDYTQFYNDILGYLTDPAFARKTKKLMDWWNKTIFPPKRAEPADTATSTISRLRQQAREQAEAAGDAGQET